MSKKRYGERVKRDELLIGTYYLGRHAQNEENVRRLADAGIDFIVREEYSNTLLDLLAKHGIGAFPIGILPQQRKLFYLHDQIPVKKYDAAAKTYTDHPAVYGPFIGWRSNKMNFEHYGKLIARAKELFPQMLPFFSLASSYPEDITNGKNAPMAIHGTYDYEEYVKEYVRYIDLDYICFEHYPYVSSPARFLENMEIVADACRESNRDLWATLQVTHRDPEHHAYALNTPKMLRFQAYTAMAFGAKAILWSTWTEGWWKTCVIDGLGNATRHYKKISEINAELKRMGDAYMAYENKSTHFLGYVGTPYLSYTKKKSENGIDLGDFKRITLHGGNATVGYFEKAGGCALMISEASDPYDDGYVTTEITFETDKTPKALLDGEAFPLEKREGRYVLPISQSCGVFVTLS